MAEKALMSDDLDYLRTLAEAGENAPLLGGRFLSWWGGVITIAYLGHYLIQTGQIGLPKESVGWLWLGVISIGVIGHAILVATFSRDKPGAGSVGNRTQRMVWQNAGLVLIGLFVALTLRVSFGLGDPSDFNWSLPVVFALYSLALGLSGYMGQNHILKIAGWGASIVVPITVWFIGSVHLYAIASIAIAITVFLPGLALLRAEPSETV